VWLGRVERVERDRVEFALVEKLPLAESRLSFSLLLAIIKFDRFEWAIEKATELALGKSRRWLRAQRKGPDRAAPKRCGALEKVLVEAAQQSRRLRPPVLRALARPHEAFAQAASLGEKQAEAAARFLRRRCHGPPLREVLAGSTRESTRQATLAIGPEGGWTPEESAAARAAGFAESSLGPKSYEPRPR